MGTKGIKRTGSSGVAGTPDPGIPLARRHAAKAVCSAALLDAVDEVERARQHYQDLYNFAPFGYISFDTKGTICEINLAAARLLGRTPKRLLGTLFKRFVTKESIPVLLSHLGRCKDGDCSAAAELVVKPASGKPIPIQILSDYFKAGSRTLFRTVLTDLTERKQSEEAVRRIQNDLEIRIKERTAELVKANHELQREIRERRRLEGEILEIIDREQRRIGQLLHDGLCQHLAAVSLMAKAISTRLERQEHAVAGEVDQLSTLLNEAVGQTRDLARGLQPVEVDADGLMAALQELASSVEGPIKTRFECTPPVRIKNSALALNLYRIAQEAIDNAVRHSQGKRINIRLAARRGAIILSVEDDGTGVAERPAKTTGKGMQIMDYRAKMIGAMLTVGAHPAGGTRVACSLPIRKRR